MVHVQGATSVDEAVRVAPYVDAVLLDSGNPGLDAKEPGGPVVATTGRSAARSCVALIDPFLLPAV